MLGGVIFGFLGSHNEILGKEFFKIFTMVTTAMKSIFLLNLPKIAIVSPFSSQQWNNLDATI